jgi:hypothetical protein
VPAVGAAGTLSSTWYCAAGSAGTEAAPDHVVSLSNPSDEEIPVRLTAFNADGQVGTTVVDAVASDVTDADVNALFGATDLSVMVESESGTLAVEHRLRIPTGADSVACSTTSSAAWFFPSQSSVLGASAKLVLFNPFSADAGVDITAPVSDGMRSPSEWAGIVVRAGTSRVIDLGQYVQRRDQFAVSVKLRSGQVVAETAQSFAIGAEGDVPATRGVQLQLGIPEAFSEWTFATGFTGQGTRERLVVYNPNRDASSVVVQVTPFSAAEMPPEPFELDVPGNRFATIDLSAESRVPGEGYHAIKVESDEDAPVVVGRVIQLSGPQAAPSDPAFGPRPPLTLGTTIGTGSPVTADRWLLPSVPTGGDQQPVVFVHNPGTGIATVTVRALAGEDAPIVIASDVEIAPGDSGWISLSVPDVAAAQDRTFEVTANAPVVVERTLTFVGVDDLTVGLALPFQG